MLPWVLLIVFLISPVAIILLTEKNKLASRIGSIIIAYAFGLLLGNVGLIPEPGDEFKALIVEKPSITKTELLAEQNGGAKITAGDIMYWRIHKLQDLLLTLSIPLALPLLLFSLRIRAWFRMAGKAFISMIAALIAVILVIGIVSWIFHDRIQNMDKIGGMLVGLYTGGTPNLAALKMVLNVDPETYIKVHTYDMIPSLIFLLFLMSFGKVLFRKFLPPYPHVHETLYNNFHPNREPYADFLKPHVIRQLLIALACSVLIFAISAGLSFLFPEKQMLVVILSITTLSILASLLKYINRIEQSFELGMYFILLFSVVVASMAGFKNLVHINLHLMAAISITIFATLFLHTLFCRLASVDADTLMVTSTALICSPPFVPMVAGALRNKEVIVSGLTVGIIGYAAGNYLGILIARLLEVLF